MVSKLQRLSEEIRSLQKKSLPQRVTPEEMRELQRKTSEAIKQIDNRLENLEEEFESEY